MSFSSNIAVATMCKCRSVHVSNVCNGEYLYV